MLLCCLKYERPVTCCECSVLSLAKWKQIVLRTNLDLSFYPCSAENTSLTLLAEDWLPPGLIGCPADKMAGLSSAVAIIRQPITLLLLLQLTLSLKQQNATTISFARLPTSSKPTKDMMVAFNKILSRCSYLRLFAAPCLAMHHKGTPQTGLLHAK